MIHIKRAVALLLSLFCVLAPATGCVHDSFVEPKEAGESLIPDTVRSEENVTVTSELTDKETEQDSVAGSGSVSVETEKNDPFPVLSDVPLFTEEARAGLPEPMSNDEKSALLEELEKLFDEKPLYEEEAKIKIRDSMILVMDNYHFFRQLFFCTGVPDAATFLRKYFLGPLRDCIDTVWMSLPGGFAEEDARRYVLPHEDDPVKIASDLVAYLWVIGALQNNRFQQSDFLRNFINGGCAFCRFTLIGSEGYKQFFKYSPSLFSHAQDPDSSDKSFVTSFFGDNFFLWFRLFTLTDFDTVSRFTVSDADTKIRGEMTRRYGEDGKKLYDLCRKAFENESLKYSFMDVIAIESLYLRLIVRRIDDIGSQSEMLSFLQTYRAYRLAMGSEYIRAAQTSTLTSGTLELLVHPDLDYAAADGAVAAAAVRWKTINFPGTYPDGESILAAAVSGYPSTGTDYQKTRDLLNREPYVITDFVYTSAVNESGVVTFTLYGTDPESGKKTTSSVTRKYYPANREIKNY